MKKRCLSVFLSLGIVACLPASQMKAEAKVRTLNIISTFGISETSTYGVPNAFMNRYNEITEKVAAIYQNNFSITLNFSYPKVGYVVDSVADQCRRTSGNGNYDSFCQHVSNQYCSNSGSYHCTNCGVIKSDVFPSSNITSEGYQMHITAVRLCHQSTSKSHISIDGMHYPSGFIVVRDTDYTKETDVRNPSYCDVVYVSKTVAHEIGHAYGVTDHYSSVTDGNPNCIWGYNRNDPTIAENLTMCSACRIKIARNSAKYNQ